MFSGLLSARFEEMTQKPDAPFLMRDQPLASSCALAEATTPSALVARRRRMTQGLAALVQPKPCGFAGSGFTQNRAGPLSHRLPEAVAQPAASNDETPPWSLADEYYEIQRRNRSRHRVRERLVQRFLPEISPTPNHSRPAMGCRDRNRVVRRAVRPGRRSGRADEAAAGSGHQGRRWRRPDGA